MGIQNDGSELWLHIGITGKLSKVPTSSSSAFGSWGGERWAWCFSEVPYDSHMKPEFRPTDVEELESQSLASRTLDQQAPVQPLGVGVGRDGPGVFQRSHMIPT